jgi:hypothetical protein
MSTPPTPAPGTPPGAPQTAPPKPSSAIWWVLGIFATAVFIVIVGGLVTAGYFVRNIHVDEKSQKVEVSTPAGKITLHASDSIKSVGLPVYPGAEMADSGGGVELTAPNDKSLAVAGMKYRTSDDLAKVDAWYRKQLGPDFERRVGGDRPGRISIHGVDLERGDLAFISEGEGLVRIVALKNKGDATEIGLVRIGKQETQ